MSFIDPLVNLIINLRYFLSNLFFDLVCDFRTDLFVDGIGTLFLYLRFDLPLRFLRNGFLKNPFVDGHLLPDAEQVANNVATLKGSYL